MPRGNVSFVGDPSQLEHGPFDGWAHAEHEAGEMYRPIGAPVMCYAVM